MAGKKGASGRVNERRRVVQQDVRDKIQATLIAKHLQDHVVGKKKMEATQVTAALGLLKKTVPDLQAVQHSGDPDNPVPIVYQSAIPRKAK